MLYWQFIEYTKPVIRVFLIFYGAADYNIFISATPWYTLYKRRKELHNSNKGFNKASKTCQY